MSTENETNKESIVTESETSSFKVKLQDGKTCEKILTIEVDSSRVEEEFDSFYKSIAPKAKVPGFRPGHAPRDILELHYEKNAKDSVLEQLLSETLPRALREKDLKPLTTPEIQDLKFSNNELSYKALIEIRPKVKLSKIVGLTAKKEKVIVKPEDVEKTVEQIREMQAQYKVVEERGAKAGDFVVADYVCDVEGKEIEKRDEDWIEIKEDEYLKGFSTQLIGAKAGDEKDVKITFPKDMADKRVAGKEGIFKVKVKEVKEKILPKVDDEFAKQAGEYNDLNDMRQKLSVDLEKRIEAEKEAAFEREILNELVKHNKIDLPEGLVRRRAQYLLDQSRDRFLRQGGTEELFEKEKEKMSKEIDAEAKRQIQVAFLLDEIAETQGFKAEETDLAPKYEALSKQFRQPKETVEKYYNEHIEAKGTLLDQIRNEKAIDYLKQNAKIK